MSVRNRIASVLGCVFACIAVAGLVADELETGFRTPPPEARPWVYWVFMDGNMTREGITADLEAMQRAGIGGAIIMEVDVGIPRGPVRFMSDEWRAHFKHAVAEAARLGLKFDIITGPGWTGSGGPWVKPEQSMQYLVASETTVRGPTQFNEILPRPQPRRPFPLEGRLPEELEKARCKFFRDVFVLALPTRAGRPGIPGLDEKALYQRDYYSSQTGAIPFLPAPADYPTVPLEQCVDHGHVIDLTEHMSADGRLTWEVPAGDWTILRYARVSTGQTTRPAPLPGLGLECDKLDKAALDAHFQGYIGTLLKDVAPYVGQSLVSIHMDSWEIGPQNWTEKFREEFHQRRSYDLLPHIPVLAGIVVDSRESSERFLWDLRQTVQELIVENHSEHLKTLAARHGLLFSFEPYDQNPTGDLTLAAPADVPMCEFWSWGFDFDTDYTVFEAASIAHVNGRPVVAAEAFTALNTERWQQHPGRMKAQSDWAFCNGVNRFVFHRYQHQPWPDRGVPGMTMGPWGMHWEHTQTWWEMVPAYHEFVARCQFMLQRGLPVADILYLAGEGAPHVFRPPTSAMRGGPADRRGFNFDGCAPETLRDRVSVSDGKLVLPDGMSYRVLVLPDFDTMTPGLLRKVSQLVNTGATVIGTPPRKSPSLSDYPQCDVEVRQLAEELWRPPAAEMATGQHRVGKGLLIEPGAAFADHYPITMARWIWHAAGKPRQGAPVGPRYFRRGFTLEPGRFAKSAQLALTADNRFEAWLNGQPAGSGDDHTRTYIFDITRLLKPGTNVLAVMAENGGETPNPAGLIGTLKVQFRAGDPLVLTTDSRWQSAASPAGDWRTRDAADAGWTDALDLGSFGMPPWSPTNRPARFPDIYTSYEFVATVLADMAVPPDFESDPPLRYTHRRDGDTDFYYVGNPEDRVVTTNALFRVSGKLPELWDPLTGECRELPEFTTQAGRTTVPLRFDPHGSFFIVFRQPAGAATATGRNFHELTTLAEVTGPWHVRFQTKGGAPAELEFNKLLDWSKHPDPGVRHFSGVATYHCAFDAADSWFTQRDRGARIYLDLGRVAVMARVILNDQDLGVAWTPPLHVDATDALRSGTNQLEIRVANLWPNRLIADAALPENERVTWTTWNPFASDTPLLESGLLGPVTLQAAQAPSVDQRKR
ncbi:MAG: hypothetical protein KKB50_08935 [Planctomycetes bacterium]|nr:hypothetical protein [Planctomycetota bacterium]